MPDPRAIADPDSFVANPPVTGSTTAWMAR